jgi:hypothetical protein
VGSGVLAFLGKYFLLSLSALFAVLSLLFSIPFSYIPYFFPRIIQPFPHCFHQFPPSFHINPPYFIPFLPILLSSLFLKYFFGGFFFFFSYYIQHCFICRPSDSTVSTDAGIEPRTVATGALTVRRSNH